MYTGTPAEPPAFSRAIASTSQRKQHEENVPEWRSPHHRRAAAEADEAARWAQSRAERERALADIDKRVIASRQAAKEAASEAVASFAARSEASKKLALAIAELSRVPTAASGGWVASEEARLRERESAVRLREEPCEPGKTKSRGITPPQTLLLHKRPSE